MDFFVVPTVTFRTLYVLVVMAHERRKIIHFNITDSPTAFWTGQQIVNAFPENTAPRYLIRDRDGIYGRKFAGIGDPRKAHCSTLTLAKSIGREADRFAPS